MRWRCRSACARPASTSKRSWSRASSRKQLQYADRAGIRFVVIRGEDEAARGVVAVKDLRRGEQFEVPEAELAHALQVEREQLRALPEIAADE